MTPCARPKDTWHAQRDFGVSVAPTQLYLDYLDSLNKRLFHLDQYRPAPTTQVMARVKLDLNRRVAELAQDILGLWAAFSRDAPQVQTELATARQRSIDQASK